AADQAFVLSVFRERGLELREHPRAVGADAAIPVLLAERRRATELVARLEPKPRPRLTRLEPPPELELDAARRIEQRLLQRDRHRPDAFDDAPAPQHGAALLLVARPGRQDIAARAEQPAAPSPVADDADERGEDLRHRPIEKRFVMLPLHVSLPRRQRYAAAREASACNSRAMMQKLTERARSSPSCGVPRDRDAHRPRVRADSADRSRYARPRARCA